MSRLKQLITEVHRRSIWQVLGIYLVGFWVAYQITLGIVEGLGLPDWVPPFAIILFIIGLPIVLATAFVQEGLPGAAAPAAVPEPAIGTTDAPPGAAVPRPPLRQRLTWRRAITAGVLAFALLGVAVTGFMGMRALGVGPAGSLAARGELGERAQVLVAQFAPLTGDSLLARVVTEAFRVDLSQSTVLNTVDLSRIRYALQRMGRPDDTPLRDDVAREVAIRLGLAVVLEGEIGQVGSSYLLSARLVNADSGRVIVQFRETAKDSTKLLDAVDRLSRALRTRAGESLKTIRGNPTLAQVTTSSLPALRKYMMAQQLSSQGNRRAAVQFYRDALALDPEFANAHRALAVNYRNMGWRSDTMLYHMNEAVRQGDRLTERELHHARGTLFMATGQVDAARREYETLLALDSADNTALINLGVLLGGLGENEQAEALYRRAMAGGFRTFGVTYWNVAMTQLDRRQFDRARETADAAAAEHPTLDGPEYLRLQVLLSSGDFQAAEKLLQANRWDEDAALYELTRGRTAAIRRLWSDETADDAVERAYAETFMSYAELWVERQPVQAIRGLAAAIRAPALDSVPAADRPDPYAALVLAAAGEVRLAREIIARFEARVPAGLLHEYEPALLAARAFALMNEGKLDSAVSTMRLAQRRVRCAACLEALRGQVFEAAAMPDSAAAAYDRYTNTGWQDRFMLFPNILPNDPMLLALSHERAGMLYDQLGDHARARSHYGSFVALWENAGPEQRPRVQAARDRLAMLSTDGAR